MKCRTILDIRSIPKLHEKSATRQSAEDLRITGNVSSKGESISMAMSMATSLASPFVLGESATLEGNVTAEDVVIRGRLVGSVKALRVTLQSMSHVEGDIYHQSLALEQGAYFEGRSRRSDDPMGAGHAAIHPTAPPRASEPEEPASQTQGQACPQVLPRSLPESRSA
jgi:cytoskeletal protein CcmA (bactofilin family)